MARERKFSTEDLFDLTKQLLLKHGYEGFSFGIIARQLNVSRGALYKYYDNKEALITDYMVFETEQFIERLKKINELPDFDTQFDYLLHLILDDSEVQQIRRMAMKIPDINHEKVKANKEKISSLHIDMYTALKSFVDLGKHDNHLKENLPEELILGFIFHAIDLPNSGNTPYPEWIEYVKEIICHGIFTEN